MYKPSYKVRYQKIFDTLENLCSVASSQINMSRYLCSYSDYLGYDRLGYDYLYPYDHNGTVFRLMDAKNELNRSLRSSQSDKMFLESEVKELRRK